MVWASEFRVERRWEFCRTDVRLEGDKQRIYPAGFLTGCRFSQKAAQLLHIRFCGFWGAISKLVALQRVSFREPAVQKLPYRHFAGSLHVLTAPLTQPGFRSRRRIFVMVKDYEET